MLIGCGRFQLNGAVDVWVVDVVEPRLTREVLK